MGAVGAAPAFAEDDRDNDDSRPLGVGVPLIDGRDLSGGGPMEPSTPAARTVLVTDEADEAPLALMRVLLPSAATLVEVNVGVSAELFFLIVKPPASVPDSEITEGGREIGVALNIDESRRWCVTLAD